MFVGYFRIICLGFIMPYWVQCYDNDVYMWYYSVIVNVKVLAITNFMFSPFSASYATLWYSTTSLCHYVSPWWNICSSIYSSGILFFPSIFQFATHCSHFILLTCNIFLINQGSYPFSPFAMPSPNGVAEVAVSPKLDMFTEFIQWYQWFKFLIFHAASDLWIL